MIRQLSIINYALIDKVELNLNEGLTILTGETGAGKSVMMGAISLLMGERADSKKVLANREGKAVVEGVFDSVALSLRDIFDANELEWNDGQIIVRREISANGRSRAFINDSPVTLPLLSAEYDGYFERMADRIVEVMTPNQKETILRLKFETRSDKDYHGVEYYEAVIADGISNMAEFEEWVIEHRKKPMYYWIPVSP